MGVSRKDTDGSIQKAINLPAVLNESDKEIINVISSLIIDKVCPKFDRMKRNDFHTLLIQNMRAVVLTNKRLWFLGYPTLYP